MGPGSSAFNSAGHRIPALERVRKNAAVPRQLFVNLENDEWSHFITYESCSDKSDSAIDPVFEEPQTSEDGEYFRQLIDKNVGTHAARFVDFIFILWLFQCANKLWQ